MRSPSASRPSTHAPRWRACTTPHDSPGDSQLARVHFFPAQRWSQAPRPGAARLGGARRTVEGCDTGSEPRWSFAENAGAELSSSKPSFLTAASTLPQLDSAMRTHAHEYPCIEHSPGRTCVRRFSSLRDRSALEKKTDPPRHRKGQLSDTQSRRSALPQPRPRRAPPPHCGRTHAVRSGEPPIPVRAPPPARPQRLLHVRRFFRHAPGLPYARGARARGTTLFLRSLVPTALPKHFCLLPPAPLPMLTPTLTTRRKCKSS